LFAIVRDCSRNGRTRLSSLSVIVFVRVSSPLSTKPSGPRPSRPSLSTKAPCSLPALRFGEHDRPRDGVAEAVFVISASALPRASREGREAERPARTGPSTTKPRRLPAGAPVNHEAHLSWWAGLNGSPRNRPDQRVLWLRPRWRTCSPARCRVPAGSWRVSSASGPGTGGQSSACRGATASACDAWTAIERSPCSAPR